MSAKNQFFPLVKTLLMTGLLLLSLMADAGDDHRIGLFIASVDPITEAHMDVIRSGIEQLKLTKIYIIVNSSSDKDYSASGDERISLVYTALQSLAETNVHFEVLLEPAIGKRNFAIEKARNEGDGVIYQIAGQDVQPKAKELFAGVAEVKSYIMPRMNPGDASYTTEVLPGFQLLRPNRVSAISSTEVKERLEKGQSVSGMVDPAVLQQIVQKGLYVPLIDEEAAVKATYLGKRWQLLIKAIESSPWNSLLSESSLKPSQNFVVHTGVQAADNVSFNRIQSAAASDELMIRLIIKATPNLKKQEQYEFRAWCLEEFQQALFREQQQQYEDYLSASRGVARSKEASRIATIPAADLGVQLQSSASGAVMQCQDVLTEAPLGKQ